MGKDLKELRHKSWECLRGYFRAMALVWRWARNVTGAEGMSTGRRVGRQGGGSHGRRRQTLWATGRVWGFPVSEARTTGGFWAGGGGTWSD